MRRKAALTFHEAVRQLKEQQGKTDYQPCCVCAEYLTYQGKMCRRCEASILEDRERREREGF